MLVKLFDVRLVVNFDAEIEELVLVACEVSTLEVTVSVKLLEVVADIVLWGVAVVEVAFVEVTTCVEVNEDIRLVDAVVIFELAVVELTALVGLESEVVFVD